MNATELELGRIRDLTRSARHSDALLALDVLSAELQEHRDVIFLRAVNQRYLNQIPAALSTLQHLDQQHLPFGRLHQERGHCYAMLGQFTAAVQAFARAVQLNSTLTNSWRMLEQLHRRDGEFERAAGALAQLEALRRQPPELLRAASQMSDGDFTSAENIICAYLPTAPQQVESRQLLVRILLRAQRFADARAQAEALLNVDAQNLHSQSLCAATCVALGDHEAALTLYRRILARMPDSSETHLLMGHSLRANAQAPEAIEAYRSAMASRPDFGDAFWSLANLKTYRFTDDEVRLMSERATAATTDPVDGYHFFFALGREFELRGDYARSWDHYVRGNALKSIEFPYRPDFMEAQTRRQIEVCNAEFFAGRSAVGAADADPIFIVGLPRSGSTLIEQILASHSCVEGTQELSEVPRLAAQLHRYPQALAEMESEEFRVLAERYLRESRAYRRGQAYGKVRFIDKMPNNFRHVGLIHLMLPNAKIIDVRREPMACCLGNFKQLYAGGHEFSYSLDAAAHYYRCYLKLMRHWQDVLPGSLLRVHYEDVVDDLGGSVRRSLNFCGLDFESACLAFHATRRNVSSASSEQVRRPIFKDSLSSWGNFEPWLGPLKDALGDALTHYRD
jgi:tetratricopeptide (TPR) repeat protein